MKKIISIILSILLFASLLAFTAFYSIQQELALFDKGKALELTKEDIERYSNMSLDELHQEFDDDIEREGLPKEILDYVVKHPDYESTIEEFKEDYIDYLKGHSEKPKINQSRMENILNDSVKEYNKKSEVKIEPEKAKIVTEKVTTKVETVVDEIDENETVRSALTFIFNLKYQKYSLIACLAIIILLVIIQKLKSILYMTIPFILNGISFLILYVVSKNTFLSSLENILGNTYIKTCNSLLIFGTVYLILGVVFVFIYNIFIKEKKSI